jgi:hypothetical protein
MITAHIQQEPRKLSELRPEVDADLEELLARCLAKEPAHRPNAGDIADRLVTLPADVTPIPPTRAAPTGLFSRLTERRFPYIMIVYGAVAWGILQVVDQLADRDIVGEVIYQLALVAVITGLPAVLLGAWFHGQKGRQEFEPVEYWLFGALALIWLGVSALILVKWL